MGLTVRFPNGQAVTYNDATQLYEGGISWELYTKKKDNGGKWVASIQVSSGAIIEAVKPCKVENPLANVTGEKALQYVLDHAEELSKMYPGARLVKKLKQKLAGYSTRSGKWSA